MHYEFFIPTAGNFGVTYTRWGRTSCPNNTDAQLVYSGRAGGTNFNVRGGSADIICLPDDPDYIPASISFSSTRFKSVVQGAEFEGSHLSGDPVQYLHEHNAPCAVCDVPTRARVIMIPAKTVCPPSWTREYYGYMMTEHDEYHRSSYACIDIDAEVVLGEENNSNPLLLYPTVTDCNGLSCPPYENDRQLSCVVCTK